MAQIPVNRCQLEMFSMSYIPMYLVQLMDEPPEIILHPDDTVSLPGSTGTGTQFDTNTGYCKA